MTPTQGSDHAAGAQAGSSVQRSAAARGAPPARTALDAHQRAKVSVEINGRIYEQDVESRTLLSDFIRHQAGLRGTKVGCEHGVCGACTVQLDGEPIRSCLMLAIQAHGRSLRTVEGLAGEGGDLSPLQRAFSEHHALQCGFCTPGMLMTADALLRSARERGVELDERAVRAQLAGNLCRCTGYQGIVAAVLAAARSPI
ncbi:MAG TPA: (2Fe-2S)-binding protein [Solirubrobacteraceae bacterium]|nr:(2Fe-2S)-binding protein [Solirubrobacteraceae bacterium]